MSLRNRIVVVFVLLILVVPATGWAASQELNPDGRQLTAMGNDSSVSTQEVGSDPALPRTSCWKASASTSRQMSSIGIFDRFLVWLQAVVQPL